MLCVRKYVEKIGYFSLKPGIESLFEKNNGKTGIWYFWNKYGKDQFFYKVI